jgi:hypothetical protein
MAIKITRFEMHVANPLTAMHDLFERFRPYVLNRTEWRGKEPRSCAITRVESRPAAMGTPTVVDIEVTYRPKGHITYTGRTKYDGWVASRHVVGYIHHVPMAKTISSLVWAWQA